MEMTIAIVTFVALYGFAVYHALTTPDGRTMYPKEVIKS
jgi:hypothetical protein